MVIRNYHWLNSASRVLISTCSAPLVQTGERKQFSLFDLDIWPTTLTYNPKLAKVKVDPYAEYQGQRSNGSNRRAPTDKWTDTHTHTHMDATESIIAFATRSIKMTTQHANTAAQWVVVVKFKMFQLTISLYYVGSWSRRLNHCLCFMHLAVSNHSSASVIVANTIWFCYGDDGYISYLATPTATFQPIAASDR